MNATLTHDMSVLSLITGASIPVQLVMAMLLLASLFSWYYIFLKIFTLRRAAQPSGFALRVAPGSAQLTR